MPVPVHHAGCADNLRFNKTSTGNNFDSARAGFNVGTGAINLQNRNSGTLSLGELTGGRATSLDPNTSGAGTIIWNIGGKNTGTIFAGKIKGNAANEISAVTKVQHRHAHVEWQQHLFRTGHHQRRRVANRRWRHQ